MIYRRLLCDFAADVGTWPWWPSLLVKHWSVRVVARKCSGRSRVAEGHFNLSCFDYSLRWESCFNVVWPYLSSTCVRKTSSLRSQIPFFFLINNFPELPIFSSRIPIIKRQCCKAGNFRQRKISSIATARQFVTNIFSSSAGRHSSALRSFSCRCFACRLFSHSRIFLIPNLRFVKKFSQELNLVKKLLWRKQRS